MDGLLLESLAAVWTPILYITLKQVKNECCVWNVQVTDSWGHALIIAQYDMHIQAISEKEEHGMQS